MRLVVHHQCDKPQARRPWEAPDSQPRPKRVCSGCSNSFQMLGRKLKGETFAGGSKQRAKCLCLLCNEPFLFFDDEPRKVARDSINSHHMGPFEGHRPPFFHKSTNFIRQNFFGFFGTILRRQPERQTGCRASRCANHKHVGGGTQTQC